MDNRASTGCSPSKHSEKGNPHVHQPFEPRQRAHSLPLVGAKQRSRSSGSRGGFNPFWRRLKSSKAVVEAVASNMSPAFIQTVRENVPQALVVFDHFHVIKRYNDRLSDPRRQLFNQIEEPRKKQVIKGTRWLLLKNPENLNPGPSEPNRLKAAL